MEMHTLALTLIHCIELLLSHSQEPNESAEVVSTGRQ